MTAPLRMTDTTRTVLAQLAARDNLCGADVTQTTGIPAGTVYPILIRLERHGLAESEWEPLDDRDPGRPRRRFYTLTPAGREKAAKYRDRLREAADALGQPLDTERTTP